MTQLLFWCSLIFLMLIAFCFYETSLKVRFKTMFGVDLLQKERASKAVLGNLRMYNLWLKTLLDNIRDLENQRQCPTETLDEVDNRLHLITDLRLESFRLSKIRNEMRELAIQAGFKEEVEKTNNNQ